MVEGVHTEGNTSCAFWMVPLQAIIIPLLWALGDWNSVSPYRSSVVFLLSHVSVSTMIEALVALAKSLSLSSLSGLAMERTFRFPTTISLLILWFLPLSLLLFTILLLSILLLFALLITLLLTLMCKFWPGAARQLILSFS